MYGFVGVNRSRGDYDALLDHTELYIVLLGNPGCCTALLAFIAVEWSTGYVALLDCDGGPYGIIYSAGGPDYSGPILPTAYLAFIAIGW